MITDDLDFDPQDIMPLHQDPDNVAKVAARASSYKPRKYNEPREGKKLLVLDVDYTLFDDRSSADNISELARPYLHSFLEAAYAFYDIIIWSATHHGWIELKMQQLGILGHKAYKLCAIVGSKAMITVKAEGYGVINVKPLGVIWAMYPQWAPHNTIMFDDLSRNFLMNPQCGLKIRPCRKMTIATNREQDDELLRLTQYLLLIAPLPSFEQLDHTQWEAYIAAHDPNYTPRQIRR